MRKILFVLNRVEEFDFRDLCEKHIEDVDIKIETALPKNIKDYDLVILWNYKKIIKEIPNTKNIILFHSSDLPKGKGWAPIYNTIVKKEKYYTISGILLDKNVDSGDILIQAKFMMKDEYTANELRKWDIEISLKMIGLILNKNKKNLFGKLQEGKSTFNKRRYPQDNLIDINKSVKEMLSHLRACEENAPAFFYINKKKFFIKIYPEEDNLIPNDLKIDTFIK